MKVGIMQPYIFPYIGYFQLIQAVDTFIIYDNIKFTKKGWINRNRILVNGRDEYFTLPLKKGSDFLNVDERFLADNFAEEQVKILRRMRESYKKAPFFESVFPLLESVFTYADTNLFQYIYHSVTEVCKFLDINTRFIVSSELKIDHSLKSQEKVLALCKSVDADCYINPIGGMDLYAREVFLNQGIELKFINSEKIEYKQFGAEFLPWMSIIDVMMFNDKTTIKSYLQQYTLL